MVDYRRRAGPRSAAVAAVLAATLSGAAAVASIGGSYNGSGKGFTIAIQVTHGRVRAIQVSCFAGGLTVLAKGPFKPIAHNMFSYSGTGEANTTTKPVKMKVTGTFSRNGRKITGTASTGVACRSGAYTATR